MTTLAIRKKLVNYMKTANDKKIKAVYTLLETELKEKEYLSLEEYNAELAEAEAEYKRGDYITNSAMKKKISKW